MNPDAPEKILFVASTGGHLAQLARLSIDLNPSAESVWVTFRTPQSEALLEGKRTFFVPYVKSRDVIGVVRAWRAIRGLLNSERFDRVISTGAALALSALPAAKRRGIPTTYIESVSRVEGPSLTGRIVALTRSAELWTQHPGWASARWREHESVFGTYRPEPRRTVARPRLFVTLGTIQGYRFDSLVDAVLRTGLADERTVWQLGNSPRTGLPGHAVDQVGADEFRQIARSSDVVVSHAGVGTLLDLFELGIYPVVVPRRKARREHVDDHQTQIASLVQHLGVGTYAETDSLTSADLVEASGFTVRKVEDR